MAKYNFYEKVWEHYDDAQNRYKSILNDTSISEDDKQRVAVIVQKIEQYAKGVPPKHKNQTLPRLDTRCTLCRSLPANQTGSHMVPNFLTAPTFTWNGTGKRGKEVVDHFFLNDMSAFRSYYGQDVSPERIAQSLGHDMTDEEIESNLNCLEYDNIFCSSCEKHLSVLESAYSMYYNRQKKQISPRIAYMFWLSVLWRMSIGRIGLYMDFEDEKSLRELLNLNIHLPLADFEKSNTDLGHWMYALFRAKGLLSADKGVFASRNEKSPYVTVYNDLVMVFFHKEPKDDELTVGPITVKREMLNNWQGIEKEQEVDRQWFWSVRDWIIDTDYDFYDPAREQALLIVRERERNTNRALSEEAKDICIKARRLVTGPRDYGIRLRKFYRISIASMRKEESLQNGTEYDPLKDEELYLNDNDFLKYYNDLAALSREGYEKEVMSAPFYKEAKQTLQNPDAWKSSTNESIIDHEWLQAVDWINELHGASRGEKPLMPIFKGRKIGRNEMCPCGSGKKYKHCCGK